MFFCKQKEDKMAQPKEFSNEEPCSYDDHFQRRIDLHHAKIREIAENGTYYSAKRLYETMDQAMDLLTSMLFQSSNFGNYLRQLVELHEGTLPLRHPKHETVILTLFIHDGQVILCSPFLPARQEIPEDTEETLFDICEETTLSEDDITKLKSSPPIEHANLILKVARKLKLPNSAFDYFIEVFGPPQTKS